jgi:hypothetical protein
MTIIKIQIVEGLGSQIDHNMLVKYDTDDQRPNKFSLSDCLTTEDVVGVDVRDS